MFLYYIIIIFTLLVYIYFFSRRNLFQIIPLIDAMRVDSAAAAGFHYFPDSRIDSRIPALAVDRLEEALREAPVRLDVERQAGDHLRPGDRVQLQEALKAVDAWLSRQGLIGS